MSRLGGMLQHSVIASAERHPGARAVVGEDRTMTFAEIEDFSSRLAYTLQDAGCIRGDRVGVLMPKSAAAVASFIGVLKAGCAYVPLDPAGAPVRTAQMLRQAEPRVVLAAGCTPDVVADLASRKALGEAVVGWLEGDDLPPRVEFRLHDVELAPAETPATGAAPNDLAYILFTSGTTGTPKGVPISHASARAFIDWAVKYFRLGEEDRLSGHTALTFDLSAFDIYASLAAGAELHQVPKKVLMIPHGVGSFVEQRGLTLWFSVPSQLAYVARFDALAGRDLSSLRHVTWCGDVLAPPDLQYWRCRLPGVAFTNLYGPTEATVASSYYRVPDDFDPCAPTPIGFPCDGEELLILDDDLDPVADGEVGDIYIAGVGLSPGYWRDPERTRAAFLSDPRSPDGSGIIYRTGDRGRRGPDGAVHFLGRSDFQIKTSGYRVEPAEVESAILELKEVSACAVVPVTVNGFSGSTIACAYVPSNGAPLRSAQLKGLLADKLPGYMVPSHWLVLEELPLDGRGKIDRRKVQALLGQGAA